MVESVCWGGAEGCELPVPVGPFSLSSVRREARVAVPHPAGEFKNWPRPSTGSWTPVALARRGPGQFMFAGMRNQLRTPSERYLLRFSFKRPSRPRRADLRATSQEGDRTFFAAIPAVILDRETSPSYGARKRRITSTQVGDAPRRAPPARPGPDA